MRSAFSHSLTTCVLRLCRQTQDTPESPKKVAESKSKKRAREADSDEADTPKLSKAERKKLKKLKAEGGEAVPATAEDDVAVPKKEKKKDKKKTDKSGETGGDQKAPAGTMRELEGGVKIKDVKLGTGPAAKKGDTIAMRYIGKLENGDVFDQNTSGPSVSYYAQLQSGVQY